VAAGAALMFLLIMVAWFGEGSRREWRNAQKEYLRLLDQIPGEGSGGDGAPTERGILQVALPQLHRTDRCITCHGGLEELKMEEAPQPHTTHPGTFLTDHPVGRYGCTICHGGQGGALTSMDAHGKDPRAHWTYPLLDQPYIQSSCGKCHLAIFDRQQNTDSAAIQGMEVFLQGKSVFSREGCLGCHQARGLGGILGPDLTEQGEKTKHGYSFRNIRGEQTVSNWLKEHFRDPEMVSPGSQMLAVSLEEKELESLATFVMGLAKPEIPFDYFSMVTLREFKGVRDPLAGSTAFGILCSACHGKNGEGKDYRMYATGVPSIGNPDFLRVASGDFIRFTMEKGRSLRQMGSWTRDISGLDPGELSGIASFLKQKTGQKEVSSVMSIHGDADRGEELFTRYCKTCHGKDGKGGVAVALNQPGFLSMADDRYIIGTLLMGRENTAMPSWSILEDRELADLLSLIRSWGRNNFAWDQAELPAGDEEEGALQFHFLCSRCHGEFGEGETGPAIINSDFLEVAGDRFLYGTISRGRAHTAMFGWSSDVYNEEQLDPQGIGNIIAFMRSSTSAPFTYIHQGSNPGRRDRGAELFGQKCARCHGPEGEGLEAPALNNQEFLSAASNGYLMATITLGRRGTAMPSWGYDQEGAEPLPAADRQDLVAHIRSWQRIRLKY